MTHRVLLLATGLTLSVGLAAGADWPQWRGPDRTDVSKETGLLGSWPNGGPKLLWTYDQAGVGYSGPSVVGGKLYSAGAEKEAGKEFVFCVDVATGKELWRATFDRQSDATKVLAQWGTSPRSSPTVDGDALYVLGVKGDLACVGLDGKVRWQKNMVKDLGGRVMAQWGWCESPLVDGDTLICCPGYEDGTVAALNKKTGDVLWRSKDLTDDASYASVVVATIAGVRQYVVKTDKHVAGVSTDGKLLWQEAVGVNGTAVIPTCVVKGDIVFSTCGYLDRGGNCGAIEVTSAGGKLSPKVLYKNTNLANHHGGVIGIGDYVYGYAESGRGGGGGGKGGKGGDGKAGKGGDNKGGKGGDGKASGGSPAGWVCLELKTGKVVWSSDKLDKGSCTSVDGKLICCGERSGSVALIDASPEGWKEHGRFSPPKKSAQRAPGGMFWTHPVVADGRLYVRDQELLFCYDLRPGTTTE